MTDMGVTDMGPVKYPSRWPWVVAAVVIVAVLAGWRMMRKPAAGTEAAVAADGSELVPSSAPAPVMPPPPEAARLLAAAREMERSGAMQEARETYYQALASLTDAQTRRGIEDRLGPINTGLLLSPAAMPEKQDHIVQPGESLQTIARRYGTTVELIQRGNRIMNPNRIKAGDVLRVFTGKFRIEVSKSRNELILFMNDRFFKRYAVATGAYGKTPLGTFEVRDKTVDPTWWRPDGKEVPFGDKENILGTRWMSIRATGDTPDARGYGIHGTWDNASIGKAASAGCVRMINAEVEELFDMAPPGAPVLIQE